MADVLGTVGSLGSVIAAAAALITVLYARATVVEARASRRESGSAHAEELVAQARVLEATRVAAEQEAAERAQSLRAEIVLHRLTQVGRVEELLGEVADLARYEIANPAPLIGAGPGRWSRVTGALVRLEAAVLMCDGFGTGSQVTAVLHEAKTMAGQRRSIGTPLTVVVGESMSLLSRLGEAAASEPALILPNPSVLSAPE